MTVLPALKTCSHPRLSSTQQTSSVTRLKTSPTSPSLSRAILCPALRSVCRLRTMVWWQLYNHLPTRNFSTTHFRYFLPFFKTNFVVVKVLSLSGQTLRFKGMLQIGQRGRGGGGEVAEIRQFQTKTTAKVPTARGYDRVYGSLVFTQIIAYSNVLLFCDKGWTGTLVVQRMATWPSTIR